MAYFLVIFGERLRVHMQILPSEPTNLFEHIEYACLYYWIREAMYDQLIFFAKQGKDWHPDSFNFVSKSNPKKSLEELPDDIIGISDVLLNPDKVQVFDKFRKKT